MTSTFAGEHRRGGLHHLTARPAARTSRPSACSTERRNTLIAADLRPIWPVAPRDDQSGRDQPTNDTYVVFGTKTPGAAMPTSGSAHLHHPSRRHLRQQERRLCGSRHRHAHRQFRVGHDRLFARPSPARRKRGGTGIAFGTLDGTGTISRGGFAGSRTGTTNGSGYLLDVNGNFYGPAAEEVGGIHLPPAPAIGGNGTGAFVGN